MLTTQNNLLNPIRSNPLAPNSRARNNSLREAIIQSRLNDQQLEMSIRAKEDERIQEINDRIITIENILETEKDNPEIDPERLQGKIVTLTEMISTIRANRAEREKIKEERELKRQQLLIEDATRASEPPPITTQQLETEEDEETQHRNHIKHLTLVAVAMDRVSMLRQNLTNVQAEAGALRRAMNSENSNYTKIGSYTEAGEDIIVERAGRAPVQDFRNRQLNQLEERIIRSDTALQYQVGILYAESMLMQKNQLNEYKQELLNIDKVIQEYIG